MQLKRNGKLDSVGCVNGVLHLGNIGRAMGLQNSDIARLVEDNADIVSVYPGRNNGHGVTFDEAGRMDQWDLGNLSDRKKLAIRDFAATFRRVNRALAGGSLVAEEIHVMSDAEAAAILHAPVVSEEAKSEAGNDKACARSLPSVDAAPREAVPGVQPTIAQPTQSAITDNAQSVAVEDVRLFIPHGPKAKAFIALFDGDQQLSLATRSRLVVLLYSGTTQAEFSKQLMEAFERKDADDREIKVKKMEIEKEVQITKQSKESTKQSEETTNQSKETTKQSEETTKATVAVEETKATVAVEETKATVAVEETKATVAVEETKATVAVEETKATVAVEETKATVAVEATKRAQAKLARSRLRVAVSSPCGQPWSKKPRHAVASENGAASATSLVTTDNPSDDTATDGDYAPGNEGSEEDPVPPTLRRSVRIGQLQYQREGAASSTLDNYAGYRRVWQVELPPLSTPVAPARHRHRCPEAAVRAVVHRLEAYVEKLQKSPISAGRGSLRRNILHWTTLVRASHAPYADLVDALTSLSLPHALPVQCGSMFLRPGGLDEDQAEELLEDIEQLGSEGSTPTPPLAQLGLCVSLRQVKRVPSDPTGSNERPWWVKVVLVGRLGKPLGLILGA
jgi:hypothetical protein